MKEKIRRIIKEHVDNMFESGGKQDDLYNYTGRLTTLIVKFLGNYINQNKEELFNGSVWGFSIPDIPSKEIREKTLIGKIKISVEYINSSDNKISGSFKGAKLMEDGYYDALLELRVKISKDITFFTPQIEYWISHELHHVFRHIKTVNKETKERFLNRAKNYINFDVGRLAKNNVEIRIFMAMIYLSLPLEVAARQQETSAQIKNLKTNTPSETIEYLQQFPPINDARKMINYSIENIKILDENTLQEFINIFNSNLKTWNLKTFIKNDKNSFFFYWEDKINRAGEELRKKILRMVSDKHMIKEGVGFLGIGDDLLNELS